MLCDVNILEYSLVPVEDVKEKLRAGYWLYGSPVYDPKQQRYLQSVVLPAQHSITPGPIPTIHLTEREAECLYWAAQGETAKGIARQLGNSKNTVNRHLSRLREKFDSVSTRQVVAKAEQWGYLENGKIKMHRKLK